LRLHSFSWRRTCMWEYGCRSTCRRAWLWFCRQNTQGQNHGWRCPEIEFIEVLISGNDLVKVM
jgi:hypothetical protein